MNWKLVKGAKSKRYIEEFAKYMLAKHGAGAGPSFIWLYVIFQFSRFELTNFRPTSHTNFILPTMCFGNSAIEKYEERKTIDTLTLRSPWMQKYKLSQQEFVRKYGLTFTTSMQKVNLFKVERTLMKYRDPIKAITSQTMQGMDMCEDMTDLYNSKDPSCQDCGYQTECKALLQTVNPKIYLLRGYE